MTGTRIQHYAVGDRLGSGGMGDVYLAEDTRLGRAVALKFLSPAVQADAESRQRLLTEARAASVLRSPHIAVTYDIGEHAGSAFIAMEYVEGELVSRRIERGPVPPREAAEIAAQVADALDEAHGRGIVHRDIKSANLIITPRGLVKVLDFGLAKFLARRDDPALTREGVTVAGMVLGTVSYMSPEQALGRTVDHRSDLFSLGVVLYELLAGTLPFGGGSAIEIIDRLLHAEPAPPGAATAGVPPELDAIVLTALEKAPEARYQSARALHLELRAVVQALDGRALIMAPASTRVPRPAVRGTNAVAVMTFSNISGEPADEWLGSGIAETVTTDLKKLPGLSVIGRAQVFEALKGLGGAEAPRLDDRVAIEIGRRLGATWIVGGGYQRMGDLIRITAQFVDVGTGELVRTVKADGPMGDIFTLQDTIVYELSQGLNLHLGFSEIAGIERQETRSVEAYEAYSRGMMNLRLASRESLDRAVAQFERALQHDPDYAAAWAALGGTYELKGAFLSMPDLLEKAIACERRAIGLDPRLAAAHAWLGDALMNLGRHDEAIAEQREAVRLDPESASVRSSLARALWVGKGLVAEGIGELERTVALNPESGYAYLQLALLYGMEGDYARAEAACRQAIALQEQYISGSEGLQIIGAHTRLGHIYYLQGRYDEALREYEREMAFLGSSDHALRERSMIELNQKIGAAHLRRGDPESAGRHFERALAGYTSRLTRGADDPFTRYYVAGLHALRGESEQAVRVLSDASMRRHAIHAVRVARDPDFENLRVHPAYASLFGHGQGTAAG
jgi:tetratricopeptide (TPR) repeat protein